MCSIICVYSAVDNRLKWLCGILMGDARLRRREIDYFLTTDRNYLSELLVLKEMCLDT